MLKSRLGGVGGLSRGGDFMNKGRKKLTVQASNTTNTYVYCFIAAKQALEHAEKQEGRLYFCMTAGLFAAFTIEAYLNHIGQDKVRNWNILERKLGPREKLALLQGIFSLKADQSKSPFQSLNTILSLRNSIVHGKTETITSDTIVNEDEVGEAEYPQTDWKKLCTVSSVTKMVNDVEAMVISIHHQLGYKRDPFASPGHGTSLATPIE
jgi:hypothetical protein